MQARHNSADVVAAGCGSPSARQPVCQPAAAFRLAGTAADLARSPDTRHPGHGGAEHHRDAGERKLTRPSQDAEASMQLHSGLQHTPLAGLLAVWQLTDVSSPVSWLPEKHKPSIDMRVKLLSSTGSCKAVQQPSRLLAMHAGGNSLHQLAVQLLHLVCVTPATQKLAYWQMTCLCSACLCCAEHHSPGASACCCPLHRRHQRAVWLHHRPAGRPRVDLLAIYIMRFIICVLLACSS